MAGSKTQKKQKGNSYAGVHKLKAAVVLLATFVVAVAGLIAKVSLFTILLRSTVVFFAVALISRIVIQILKTNEEMNGG